MGKFRQFNTRSGKLTPSEVLDIRLAYANGATQGSLARQYRMSIGQIGRIVRGESWNQYQQVETNQEIEHQIALDRMAAMPLSPSLQEAADKSAAKLLEMLAKGDDAGVPPPSDSIP